MLTALLGLVKGLIDVYKLLIVVYCIISVMNLHANRWTELLRSVIEPALTPVRRLMGKLLPDRWTRLDWSPAALFILLTVVQWVL